MIFRMDAPDLHAAGDKLKKGHWHHHLITGGSHLSLAFEYYLETLRLRHAPDKISRLDCLFAFDKTEHGDAFMLEDGARKSVYILDLEADYKHSRHNYAIITHISKMFNQGQFVLIADEEPLLIKYWTGDENTDYTTSLGKKLPYHDELLIDRGGIVIDIK